MKASAGVWVIGMLLAVVLIGGVTWTFAYQPFDYSACVNNNSGTIFMIGPDEECGPNATKIQWNQVGPQGEKGDKGDKGDPGEQGPPGVLGFYTRYASKYIYMAHEPERLRLTARCDLGDVVTGGGGYWDWEVWYSSLRKSYPIPANPEEGLGEGWSVEFYPIEAIDGGLLYVANAICADLTP